MTTERIVCLEKGFFIPESLLPDFPEGEYQLVKEDEEYLTIKNQCCQIKLHRRRFKNYGKAQN